jgi:hypothetical protein
MEVIEVNIKDLKPAIYNPRKLTGKEYKHLRDSMEIFGAVDPAIVNSAKERFNNIIGGHQRIHIWAELGHLTYPCVYVDIPDEAKERELNLRLNKNLGEWDWDQLANFSEDELLKVGFEKADINGIFTVKSDEVKGEIEFTPELMESHNYVLLYFDNELDWQVAQDKLGIKTVKDLKGLNNGIGRVLKGNDVIANLK